MNVSLLQLCEPESIESDSILKAGGYVTKGYWMQDCNVEALEQAQQRARSIEQVNNNAIKVIVVKQINGAKHRVVYIHKKDVLVS